MSPAFKKNLTLARLKDRAAKVDIFARETDGRLAGKQIFTRPALAARASFSRHPMIYYPEGAFLHPNGEVAQPVISAHAAGSRFASRHMLAPAEGNTRLLGW